MKKTLLLPLFALFATLVGCDESAPKVYDPAVGEGYYILTPKVSDAPRINGAEVFGVRPGSPFFHTITATGIRPMTFTADNLPNGLKMDAKGTITGKIADLTARSYIVKLTASNAKGTVTEDFEIKVGEDITLTPPMGWSSWIAQRREVSQVNVINSAKLLLSHGLNNYGYSYVNIDDAWQGKSRGGEFNAIQPNPAAFSDMMELSNQIHDMGFKFGIYSTPWITSYAKFIGGSSNTKDGYWDESMIIDAKNKNVEGTASKFGKYRLDENDAKQWAAWNVDYMKYDWNPNDSVSILSMSKALRNSGRDIAFSVSNSCPMYLGDLCSDHVEVFRTNGDIRARWDGDGSHINLRDNWNHHNEWLEKGFEGRPGHTPDPDFLMVGLQNYGSKDSLTADELYHHTSSFVLWGGPLLMSFDLSTLQPFEKSLLTNVEMLDINQDRLSKPGRLKYVNGDIEVLVKELANGDKAFAIFNFGEKQSATVDFTSLGLSGKQLLRDVWRQEDIGTYSDSFSAVIPRHGVVVVRAKTVN
ncbi:MAG: glycoside hydrolase family 27 protein [Rikenellaceae bacterium]